ncbi:hypothetical protein BDBG_16696 [Blastomyces gilchristii SLH14081]|uniref:Uncharacterized protein n=1 Tax=Blastomyces gilchristii (strain SLH14081) TaxID=559298 RepID=A0A179UK55_BLAGS|nr:uncharacterized protein BDBG_16696 [Blastomyces gilchristii SLH14081]OAT06792.1 hypothetical protein BDBG_16696 [Blastomyces gilchristii SLH14081]
MNMGAWQAKHQKRKGRRRPSLQLQGNGDLFVQKVQLREAHVSPKIIIPVSKPSLQRAPESLRNVTIVQLPSAIHQRSLRHMPCLVSLEPSRKRQKPDDDLEQSQHQLKRLKLGGPPPAYWDNLSRIWLTKDTLQEFDRRNSPSNRIVELGQCPCQPLTRQLHATLKNCCQIPALDPLSGCKPESLKEIKRLSRRGGPDLSDLRNFPDPHTPFYQSMSTSSSGRRKRCMGSAPDNSDNKATTKTTSTTVYNQNFQQNLVDHGVYPPGYKYPNGQKLAKPNNWLELNE